MVDKVRLIRGSDGAVEKLKDMGDGTFATVVSTGGGGGGALPTATATTNRALSGGASWTGGDYTACKAVQVVPHPTVDIEWCMTEIGTYITGLIKAGTAPVTIYLPNNNANAIQFRRFDQSATLIYMMYTYLS